MEKGWIKAWRSSLESEIFKDETLFKLWMMCLWKASHKECEIMVGKSVVHLEPGQFVTGRFALHEDYYRESRTPDSLQLTPLSIWNYLKKLAKLENVIIKATNKFSIISIVNWEKYQGDQEEFINRVSTEYQQDIIKVSQTRREEEKEGKNIKSQEEKIIEKEKKKEISGIIKSVVEHLNKKSQSEFKVATKGTQDVIKARLNNGFSLKDFKTVIDFKVDQWLGKSEYSEFLRPQTLFGNKMEGYLQAAKKHKFVDPYTCKQCQRTFEKEVSKHEGLCDECLHKAR